MTSETHQDALKRLRAIKSCLDSGTPVYSQEVRWLLSRVESYSDKMATHVVKCGAQRMAAVWREIADACAGKRTEAAVDYAAAEQELLERDT